MDCWITHTHPFPPHSGEADRTTQQRGKAMEASAQACGEIYQATLLVSFSHLK